jgi:predicted MFS family arabinose efflux permease
MGSFPNLSAASFSFISLALIFSVGGAVRNVLSQEIVQPHWRSSTSGIQLMGFALGFAIPALVGGWVISQIQFGGLMFISAGIAALSAVLMLAYLAVTRTQKAGAPSEAQIRS